MNIGAIVRCDNTGLGIQSKEFFDHIPGCRALVIDMSGVTNGSPPQVQNHHWYPGHQVVKLGNNLRIPHAVLHQFIDGLDLVMCFETPYEYALFNICRDKGIKTVMQINWEFLETPPDYHHPVPDLYLSPSSWDYDKIPNPKRMLPVPVNTEKFIALRKANTFVHIAGTLPARDRNGTAVFLEALRHVQTPITAIIRCQRSVPPAPVPPNVNLIYDFSNKANYADNYDGGVLVMPRKFGGLCLPANEAIGAGMPVIMPAIPPNDSWLPAEWLTDARKMYPMKVKKDFHLYEPNPVKIAHKIHEFCQPDFYAAACEKALQIRSTISWDALLPEYMKLFSELTGKAAPVIVNKTSEAVHYPFLLGSDKYKMLLAAQEVPEKKFYLQDREIELDKLIDLLENIVW